MSDDPDHDHDRDHANDNGDHDKLGGKQVAPAPTGGALAALAKLQTDLAKVNTAAIIGRSGLPMLLFKSRDNGTWGFGQKRTIPEPGSRWAINPLTFKRGYICFNNNKPAGEQLLSVSEPEVDVTKLPNTGFEWQPEWAVNMKCLDGADAGIEVIFKSNTVGGIQAIVMMLETVRTQLENKQNDGKIVPLVLLENYSYPHPEFGKTWNPMLKLVDWMPLDGPAPAPAPAEPTPPVDQPRRRRVA